jgi:predicted Fe-Mo cluster-binding NifX family protein
MKVCFPAEAANGVDSEVYGHFGSAPVFIIVDTKDNHVTTINNKDQHHAHGACNPLKALDNQNVDAIVVGGIGAGALTKLNQQGIKVFRAQAKQVKDNIQLLKDGGLPEFMMQHTCAGHGHIKGCGH